MSPGSILQKLKAYLQNRKYVFCQVASKVRTFFQEKLLRQTKYLYQQTAMVVTIFWEFLFDILQAFLSPQVKWSMVISNKNRKHELRHELPKNLK